jgi:hypothetical protein
VSLQQNSFSANPVDVISKIDATTAGASSRILGVFMIASFEIGVDEFG